MKIFRRQMLLFIPAILILVILISILNALYYRTMSYQIDVVASFLNIKETEKTSNLNIFLFLILSILSIDLANHLLSFSLDFLFERLKFLMILYREKKYLEMVNNMPVWQITRVERDLELFAKFKEDLWEVVEGKSSIYLDSLFRFTQFISLLTLTFIFHWLIGLIILFFCLISLLFILLTRFFERARISSSRKRREYISILEESLSNYQALFFSSQTNLLIKRTELLSKESTKLEANFNMRKKLISLLQQSTNNILRIALLFVMASLSRFNWASNNLTIGMIVSTYYFFFDISYSTGVLVKNIIEFKAIRALENDIAFQLERDEGKDLEDLKQIKISKLLLTFGGKRILKEINLNLEVGERYAIIGKSGVGKTTLAEILAGSRRDYQGLIEVDGEDYKNLSSQFFAKNVSFLVSKNLILDAPLKENVVFEEFIDQEKLEKVVDLVNLSSEIQDSLKKQRSCLELSAGQKRRVCIARTLYDLKKVVILDEPFANLDSKNAEIIKKNILDNPNFYKDRIIVLISHQNIKTNDVLFDKTINMDNFS